MHRIAISTLGVAAATALILPAAAPATASPPTRIAQTFTSVVCEAWDGDVRVVVGAERAVVRVNDEPEEVVTGSRAQVSRDGETLGTSAGTPSDWTDTSVRVTMPVTDRDDNPAGEVSFAASYAPGGAPQTYESSFKDGNRRVVERGAEAALDLSDVVVQRDGVTLEVARCDGSVVDASVTFTNPRMLVQRGSALPYEDCVTTGQLGVPFLYSDTGSVAELFVESQVGDDEELLLRGLISAAKGSWSGDLELSLSGEEVGRVPSTATLTRLRPFHETQRSSQVHVTPYRFAVDAGALGSFTCTLYSVQIKEQFPNPL